jgi:hypothetical protein
MRAAGFSGYLLDKQSIQRIDLIITRFYPEFLDEAKHVTIEKEY